MSSNENKDQSANKEASNKSPMAANEANANKSPADIKNNPAGSQGQAKDHSQSKEDAEAQAKKAKEAGKNAA